MEYPRSSANIAHLAQVRAATGYAIQLKPFDTVLEVRCDDARVSVLIDTYRLRELRSGWELVAHGKRLISFVSESGAWRQADTVVIWDPSYKARRVREYGAGISPDDFANKRRWEDMAFRWGSDTCPMDSPARMAEEGRYVYFVSESDAYDA